MSITLKKVETQQIFDNLTKEEEAFIRDNFQTEPDSEFICIDNEALDDLTNEVEAGIISVPEKLLSKLHEEVNKEVQGFIHVVLEY